jgi:hypothetical protein
MRTCSHEATFSFVGIAIADAISDEEIRLVENGPNQPELLFSS